MPAMKQRTSKEMEVTTVEFPLPAVRWLVQNTGSNVELAILSNVCQQWRDVVSRCILGQDGEDEEVDEHNNSSRKKSTKDAGQPHHPFQTLLLPSMIGKLHAERTSPRLSTTHTPTPSSDLASENNTTNTFDDTYCLAWFHPDGIEFLQLPEDGDEDNFEDDDAAARRYSTPYQVKGSDDGMESFVPVIDGEVSYAMSNENENSQPHGHSRRTSRRSRSPTPLTAYSRGSNHHDRRNNNFARQEKKKDVVSCMYQWNGYSQPMEVLQPFGYSAAFVRRLFDQATAIKLKQLETQKRHGSEDERPALSAFSSASTLSARDGQPTFPPFHTLAVRGATYARPEGYCLCWDQDIANLYNRLDQSEDSSNAMMRRQEWEHVRRRRNQRRRELQREVLPVVLWSRRRGNGQQSDNGLTDNTTLAPSGILQPCVQFLNVDSSHAVRLFTPPFADGPVSTPVTIFMVAIATEDGCFFSGHKNKFEMGHLYPANADETLVERSPITLCAEYQGPFTRIFQSVSASIPPDSPHDDTLQQSASALSDFGNATSNTGYFNSDSSSCDVSDFEAAANGNPGWKCQCPLSGLGDLGSDAKTGSSNGENDHDRGNPDAAHACRGQLGPGTWHCYVAVFDGEDSVIRIDGVEEPVISDTSVPPSFKACLDGLTIGSDHTFDMSLCFGQGSDGEGEGAMAELACFKGRLEEQDIHTMESHLMKKHGIEFPNRPHYEIAMDNEFTRMAHALIAKPWTNDGSSIEEHNLLAAHTTHPVPLRYLARLRQVAWRQINPVTGEAMVVSRIGSRAATNESSDW